MSSWSRVNAGFIVNEDDSGDKFIFNGDGAGVVSTSDDFLKFQDGTGDADPQPKFLTAAADGSGDYSKENCYATDSGWVMRPGCAATGNDNPDADPEILVCSRGLRSNGTGDPTANQITIGTTSSKTTYYPDGDAFTGAGSSSANDIVVYLYFNEPVGVRGTPQITLKQATALGSDFSTMDHLSSASNYDAGIVAFGLSASVDTQTSAVTNNTLGIGSGDSWALNSGQITKLSEKLLDETNGHPITMDDGASTEAEMSYGDVSLEDSDVAELLIRASENASFTVS
jgi:hypothetical protein